jgi:hypothetical protein
MKSLQKFVLKIDGMDSESLSLKLKQLFLNFLMRKTSMRPFEHTKTGGVGLGSALC